MSKGKYWCYVHNNPEDYDIPREFHHVKYAVWQSEVGESGTEHLQGYFAFTKDMSKNELCIMDPRATWQPRHAKHSQAKKYCTREGRETYPPHDLKNVVSGPWFLGDDSDIPDTPGARNDLKLLHTDLQAGMTINQVCDSHFGSFLRYEKGIRSYISMKTDYDRVYSDGEKPIIKIFWGPPGSGKSRKALADYPKGPGAYWFTKPGKGENTIYWHGYAGEEVVVFDEFYSWIDYHTLLLLLGFGPVNLRVMYGFVKLRAKTFVFTSNTDPMQWYSKITDKSALYRRFREFCTNDSPTRYGTYMDTDPRATGPFVDNSDF